MLPTAGTLITGEPDGPPFGARLESMLLRSPPQNSFSTASVKTGKAQNEHNFSSLPPAADIRQRGWHVGSV
jgi:hypothetical protein